MSLESFCLCRGGDVWELVANAPTRGAIGMAAIGIALWKYVMKYAPHDPTYFNRDRFVLSNGKSDGAGGDCLSGGRADRDE